MDERVLGRLGLSDHVMRAYLQGGRPRAGAEASAPVWLYVGYYASQRTGSTYHSPRNCLPGAGWQLGPIRRVSGLIPGRPTAMVNRVAIEKDFERQLILYWYQDRGRVIASEYDAKLHLVWDAVTRNRTDGAFVRLSTPVLVSEDEAFARLRRFVEATWPTLAERLPG
jgi:EpsI family protein